MSRRTLRPGRWQARSRATSAGTGWSPWGEEIVVSQGGEIGRPSTLHARAAGGDGLIDAVEVGGAAVIVARGEFRF